MHRLAEHVGGDEMYKTPWHVRVMHKARHRKAGVVKRGIAWLEFAFTPVMA